MKKFIAGTAVVLLCVILIIGAVLQPVRREYKISEANRAHFSRLLTDLLNAYETPSPNDSETVASDLAAIAEISREDAAVANRIAGHWKDVYLNPEYRQYAFREDSYANELIGEGVPNSSRHAFVILGYELMNGEMTDELKGRCNAAAAAARTFPETILVCSGGATGPNNPDRHTEAGMMKDYLVHVCGIDASRVFTDETAMTTADNAVNSLAIMQNEGVRSMTIVTSSYHQRWGQVLYNAVSALYEQEFGYAPMIIANYCYDTPPENAAYLQDARIAVSQLRGILGLPGYAQRDGF